MNEINLTHNINLCCPDTPKMQLHPCRILQKCTTFEESDSDIFEESEQHRYQLIKIPLTPQFNKVTFKSQPTTI